jgi:hypothetical protein
MPRSDRSITILTGMIIAALYVILLVGFARESYMRRDAASRLDGVGGWTDLRCFKTGLPDRAAGLRGGAAKP